MKQLLALVAMACTAFAWTVGAAGVNHATMRTESFSRQLVTVERAVRGLPCVLAPPTQSGCVSH